MDCPPFRTKKHTDNYDVRRCELTALGGQSVCCGGGWAAVGARLGAGRRPPAATPAKPPPRPSPPFTDEAGKWLVTNVTDSSKYEAAYLRGARPAACSSHVGGRRARQGGSGRPACFKLRRRPPAPAIRLRSPQPRASRRGPRAAAGGAFSRFRARARTDGRPCPCPCPSAATARLMRYFKEGNDRARRGQARCAGGAAAQEVGAGKRLHRLLVPAPCSPSACAAPRARHPPPLLPRAAPPQKERFDLTTPTLAEVHLTKDGKMDDSQGYAFSFWLPEEAQARPAARLPACRLPGACLGLLMAVRQAALLHQRCCCCRAGAGAAGQARPTDRPPALAPALAPRRSTPRSPRTLMSR